MTAFMVGRVEASMLSADGLRKIQSIANRISALKLRDNLRLRFEGQRRGLKFQRRRSSWNARKQKETGQAKPLVYRGEMRRNVLTKARVTATSKQGRLISTTGARGFRTSEWRQMVRTELEQVTAAEEKSIVREQEKTLVRLANTARYNKTIKPKFRRF